MSLMNEALRKKSNELRNLSGSIRSFGKKTESVCPRKRRRFGGFLIAFFAVVTAGSVIYVFFFRVAPAPKAPVLAQVSPTVPDVAEDRPVSKAGAASPEGTPQTALDLENKPPDAEIKTPVVQQPILQSIADIQRGKKRSETQTVAEKMPATPSAVESFSATSPFESAVPSQSDKESMLPAEKKPLSQGAPSRGGANRPPRPKMDRAVVTPAERFYQKAVTYHRQNRLPEAIALYLAVLKETPDDMAARFNLAAAYIQTAAYTEAFTLLESLSARDPGNPDILLNKAISKIGSGELQQALMLLNAAEEKHAPAFELCFHRGLIFSRSGQAEEALRWYQKAEGIDPKQDRLIFNMALVHDKLQQYEAALRYYLLFLDQAASSQSGETEAVADRVRVLRSYLGMPQKDAAGAIASQHRM
jgi:Flp pilus assembly protein TadD